jgi:hypothetical protein
MWFLTQQIKYFSHVLPFTVTTEKVEVQCNSTTANFRL